MRRGIVLARAGRSATVLLDGGEFVRVPAQGWEVGDEVSLPARLPERLRRRSMRAYGYAAGALAAVLALLPVLIPAASAQVVAYVSVDINPSVELGLGSSGRILTASAIDRDGRRLLTTVHLQGKTLPQAVLTLLHAASHQGYLKGSHDVSVILAEYPAGSGTLSKSVQQGLQGARSDAARFARAHDYVGVVSALIAPSWVRTAANQQHVSVGLYAIWSALHSANVKVSLHALQGRTLGQAIAGVEKNAQGSAVLKVLSGTKVVAGNQPVQTAKVGKGGGPTVNGSGTRGANRGTSTGTSSHSGTTTGVKQDGGGGPSTGGDSSGPSSSAKENGHVSTVPPTATHGTGGTPHPTNSTPAHTATQPPIIVVTPNSEFEYSYPSSGDSGNRTSGNSQGGTSDKGKKGQGAHGTKGQPGDGSQSGTTQKHKKSSHSGSNGQGDGSQQGPPQGQKSGQTQGQPGGTGQSGTGTFWQGFGQSNLPGGGSGSGDGSSSGSSDSGSGSGGVQNPFNGGQSGGDNGGGGN